MSFSIFLLAVLCVGCSAQQSEQQALESLRLMTKDGKLPPESMVSALESRFAGKRTGALARLLRARIRFENKDYAGAADLLNSDVFAKQTKLADYAVWLRGRALQQAGDHAEAMRQLARVGFEFPDSLRARDAKLLWAESAVKSGSANKVAPELAELVNKKDPAALLIAAKAYEAAGDQANAIAFYRRTYFFGAGGNEAKEAETKLTSLAQNLAAQTGEEQLARADNLLAARKYSEAAAAYADLTARFPGFMVGPAKLRYLTAAARSGRAATVSGMLQTLPPDDQEEGYYETVQGFAKAKAWPQARSTAEEMRTKFPRGKLTAKAWVDAGVSARESKNKTEEQYFLGAALANYPDAVEVASAQFELAWMAHDANDYQRSSQMFVEHLARYADRDTTNRGKAGYWAARDSERAGKSADACALYQGVIYRYAANWYGYIASDRLKAMQGQGKCTTSTGHALSANVAKAIANLKTVTVAPETSGPKEAARAEKSEELSTIGLFDWAIDELNDAKKTAQNSPKINLALARHYRMKGDNVNALLALAKSYPDYSQMFPEEMGREEWEIFYPHVAWDQIMAWSKNRNLDPYQVAGLIRQESVFNPRAKSGAQAYGLMQLLVPTARIVARKYGTTATVTADSLFLPALNIELGTGYMRDQLDKYGRIEYMAVAYNAGPGRVPQWRATLPIEMDEFVEAIPFKETKGYVQGVIRNAAQYRRLYDENGNFRPNVGTKPLRADIDSKSAEQLAADYPDLVLDGPKDSE